MAAVVGRERELATVTSFLELASEGSAALSLEGDAGVGKTTLLREAVRLAEADGFRVLGCRPAQAEAKLAFASLTDLLSSVTESVLAQLPAPQRRALEVALLRVAPGPEPADSRTVGTALLSTLRFLADRSALLVVVDDAQWLDTSSAVVLEFALRRLRDERVGVLTTRRSSEEAQLEPARFVQPAMTVRVGTLSLAATHHLLRQHLGRAPSRPLLVRIHRTAGGNPLFALEIARLLDEIGEPRADEPLPVPSDVATLVRKRVGALPAETREVLLTAAALARPREETLRAALGRPIEADLAAAEEDGVASLERGTVTFVHPLFGAAVYLAASAPGRRAVHQRLATVSDDVEERARHLALANDEPDERVAQELEGAARLAGSRGAPATAAELLELALRATPPGAAAAEQRSIELVHSLNLAGDFGRSTDLLLQLVRTLESPDLRARAFLLLADIEYWTKGAPAACARAAEALATARSPRLRAECHAVLGISAVHDVQRSVREADAALALLADDEHPDPQILSLALCTRARGNVFLGRGLDTDAMERAIAVEAASLPALVQNRASFKYGQLLKYVDDVNGSRRLLEEALRAAEDEADESSLFNVLLNLTVTECWAGGWGRAANHAERAIELAAQLGAFPQGAASYRAYVEAHLGEVEAVSQAVAAAGESGEPVVDALLACSRALVALPLGEFDVAHEHLCRTLALHEEAGFNEPAVWRVHGDAIEAAVAVGDVAGADRLLVPFEQHAERVPIPWSLAVSARCRALVEAGRGDLVGATSAIELAIVAHESCPVSFELGRTLLVAGQLHRRAGRRRAAVDALARSEAIFVGLGARLWAARTHSELARVPIKRRAGDALTASEARVAELVAQGKTNQEVAQALFVTAKTVEANLTRIFRKLGVRSRTALAAELAKRPAGVAAEP